MQIYFRLKSVFFPPEIFGKVENFAILWQYIAVSDDASRADRSGREL